MAELEARVEGRKLVISVPLPAELKISQTGRSYIIAGIDKFVETSAIINGQKVAVRLHAVIRRE